MSNIASNFAYALVQHHPEKRVAQRRLAAEVTEMVHTREQFFLARYLIELTDISRGVGKCGDADWSFL